MLNAAVIGLGVGERHIAGYEAHPSARVVALCDIDGEKRELAAQRYPERRITGDAEQVLSDPDIHVVSVASYDDAHFDQIMAALRADKHVFVEKPLVLKPDQARAVRQALRDRPHLRLSSNLILRKVPRFADLRDRITAGEFGRIFSIEASYHYGRLQKLTHGWRGTMPGHSVVLGGGIHMIDLAMWLIGDRITDVSAVGNRIAGDGSPHENFDCVTASVRFAGGAIGQISANYGCVRPHFHSLSVFGTEATFFNDPGDAILYRSRDPETPPNQLDTAYPTAAKGDAIPSFIDAILGNGSPSVDIDDV
ncbi:MAG: Gfo/Idh/MocA family oxidoreductase, partial [Pseudomonadota bacterium]